MNLKQAKESGNWFKREGWNLWLMADDSKELGVLNELGGEVGLTLNDVIADDWITTPSLDKKVDSTSNKEVLTALRDTSIILQNQVAGLDDKVTGMSVGVAHIHELIKNIFDKLDEISNTPAASLTLVPSWQPPTTFYSSSSTLSDSAE